MTSPSHHVGPLGGGGKPLRRRSFRRNAGCAFTLAAFTVVFGIQAIGFGLFLRVRPFRGVDRPALAIACFVAGTLLLLLGAFFVSIPLRRAYRVLSRKRDRAYSQDRQGL